jgi:NADH-quinone oxidoreductase subunit D
VGVDERTTLPTKQQVYQTIEGTITHFELVMSQPRLRGAQRRSRTPRSKRPTANWAFTWWATAATWPIAPAAAAVVHSLRPVPAPDRGHTLSDVVAVLGSLNIAAELDRPRSSSANTTAMNGHGQRAS